MKQEEVFQILKMGANVFLTGPAGSGKTFLLNEYIRYLRSKRVNVAVTASTGIAATHLGGITIHSWCGMGINQSLNDAQMKNLKENEYLTLRIMYAKVLIIDEVSMLSAKVLDLVNNILQAFRQDLRPFGGVQVILCGDFFQLPPIKKHENEDDRFVVESEVWKNMDVKICYLEEQYRQEDKDFLRVLNDIRGNRVSVDTVNILKTRHNKSIEDKIKPTKLYTHNNSVEAENIFELNKLPGDEVDYEMHSEGVPHLVKSLKESYCLAPEMLRLKMDAVVMFVKNNFGNGYVNGTLGIIRGFDDGNGYPIVETFSGNKIIAEPERWVIEDDGMAIASVSQVPLRLAWAITVHKSQGMSLDCAEIDLSRTFEYGMGYVALSRVRSLAGMKLLGMNQLALQVNQKAIDLDKILYSKSEEDLREYQKLNKKGINKLQKEFIEINKKEEVTDFFGMDLPF